MNDSVLLERVGDAAIITLNRPERANVLDADAGDALCECIDKLVADGAVRAVLLRARGKHFCAGGDIAAFVSNRHDLPGLLDRALPRLHRAIHALATLPVPVISALNGPVGGGGIGLALCADIVLAAESMKLRGGYSAIGLTPDAGASWFLARRVGASRAKEIFFTNEPLSAHECLAIGVVSHVYPDEELESRAMALVQALSRGATASLSRIKVLIDGAPGRSLSEQLDLERSSMVASGGTADAIEGALAFSEKRAPVFRGR